MRFAKARFVALLIIAVSVAVTWWNWHMMLLEGRYYIKVAAFGPVGVVGGLFMLLFPSKAGKPSTAKDKVLVFVVFGIGIVLGLMNWYLMDPQFFKM